MMARGKGKKEVSGIGSGNWLKLRATGPISDGIGPETTGRYIIIFKEEADAATILSTRR